MKSNIKSIDNQTAHKRLNIISITCIVLMTLAEMISIPATTAATGSLAPQDRVGRYMGLYGLVHGIGWSMGPFLGSQLFDAYAGRPVSLWAMLSFPALMAGKRCRFAQVQSKRDDLELLGQWIADGMELPILVESRFPVRNLGEALQKRLDPARSGAIVVDVQGGW